MNKILRSTKVGLLQVGKEKLDASWDYDNVISAFSRLYLVVAGSGKIYHSYEEVNLQPGQLYLVPSFTYSRYQCTSDLELYYVHFIEEVGDGLSIYDLRDFIYEVTVTDLEKISMERLIALHPKRKLKNDDPRLYDNHMTIANLEKENNALSSSKFLETQGILTFLLSKFILSRKSSKSQVRSDFSDILNYIKEHLHEPLTVKQLAARFNLSSDHFSRVFQKKFGMRPSKYIQSVRIERSETLLLTTKNTIAQIAEKTGWESVSYYTRIFKNVTGKTPGQFRKERQLI